MACLVPEEPRGGRAAPDRSGACLQPRPHGCPAEADPRRERDAARGGRPAVGARAGSRGSRIGVGAR